MKVYLIFEEYSDFGEWKSEVEKVYMNKEKAEQYVKESNEYGSNSTFHIEEVNAIE